MLNIKKFLINIIFLIITLNTFSVINYAATLTGGISVDDVPKAMYGTWKVTAKLEYATNYGIFKPKSTDIWILSRIGDNITLTNPLTGATADIRINTIENNLVIFSKRAPYDNKMLTDTISVRINKNSFSGINALNLELFSTVDGHSIKNDSARYSINGEKISGDSILDN